MIKLLKKPKPYAISLLMMVTCCSNLTSAGIIMTKADCKIYQPIYAPRSEALLIPQDVAVKIEQHNKIWETRCPEAKFQKSK